MKLHVSKPLRNCWKRAVTVSVTMKVMFVQKQKVVTYPQDIRTLQALKVRATMVYHVLFVWLGNHHLKGTLLSFSGKTETNCDEWFHCSCV